MNTFHSVTQRQIKELFRTIINYEEQIDVYRKQLFLTKNFSPIEYFEFLDINNKNFLSLTDFSEILSYHNISFNPFTLRRLIRTYDKNGKFTINYDDFLQFISPKFIEENPQSYNNIHPDRIFINILIKELNLVDQIGEITYNIKTTKDFNVYEAFMNMSKGNNYLFLNDIKSFINDKYIKDSKIKCIIYRIDLDNDNKISYEEFQEVFFPYKNCLRNYNSSLYLNNNNNEYYFNRYSLNNIKSKIDDYIIYKTNNLKNSNLFYKKTSPIREKNNSYDKEQNKKIYSSSQTNIFDSTNRQNYIRNNEKPLNFKQLNLSPKINNIILNENTNDSYSPIRNISSKKNDINTINNNNFNNIPYNSNSYIHESSFIEEKNSENINQLITNKYNLINEDYPSNNNNFLQSSYQNYINQNNNEFNPKILDSELNEIMSETNFKSQNNLKNNNNDKIKKEKINRYNNSSNTNTIITNQETLIYPDTRKYLNKQYSINKSENENKIYKTPNKEKKENDKIEIITPQNNNLNQLFDFLIDKIEKRKLIESLKETLCLQDDITLPNLFYIFDTSKKEEIKKENFIEVCNKLNLFPTNDQIYLLYLKYDLDNDNILNYEEFCHMILPLKEEYLTIIKNRQDNIDNFTEISNDSNKLLKELIKAFIQVESYFYEMRNKMKLSNFSSQDSWNYIIHYCSNGEKLDKNEFKHFLEDNNIFLTQYEIDLIFNDIDLDNDGIIDYNDFEREMVNIN